MVSIRDFETLPNGNMKLTNPASKNLILATKDVDFSHLCVKLGDYGTGATVPDTLHYTEYPSFIARTFGVKSVLYLFTQSKEVIEAVFKHVKEADNLDFASYTICLNKSSELCAIRLDRDAFIYSMEQGHELR